MASRHDDPTTARSDDSAPDAADPPHAGRGTNATPDPRTGAVRDYQGTGIMWTGVALVVAVALFVVIALQNMHDVQFDFLWFDAAIPLSLILAITFGLALVLGEVIGFVWRHRRRTRLREREELRRLRSRAG